MKAKNKIEFIQGPEFPDSLGTLFRKGGLYQKAAEKAYQAWGKANAGETTFEGVFTGLPLTNNGENRIAFCRKFDLPGFSRLVTAYSSNVCIFLFAGDHDAVDRWLNVNKGLDFVAREQGTRLEITPVYVSNRAEGKDGLIQSEVDWMSTGPVIEQLPDRYLERLLQDVDPSTKSRISDVMSHTSEDLVQEIVEGISDSELAYTVLDVLLKLRSSDLQGAKSRVDLYTDQVKPVGTLTADDASRIASSEMTVRVQDIDPILFEHFIKTADFKQWMLYLHPQQREFIDNDYVGATRLAGVSGSGKTCVVIHRALRLARSAPDKKVLVLTLNEALAKLISELVNAESGSLRPENLTVRSVFELCREKLIALEPAKLDYYGKRIVQRNAFAAAEHIDDIWDEYFHCQANNHDAEVLFDVIRTLLARNVLPQDYLRQELDYVRSAFAPEERATYLDMQRDGRVVALERRYREMVLSGLAGSERKMAAVGAIDDVGIVTALYSHVNTLSHEFDHVLVDEVQDLGTLELRIIRRLTRPGTNDLFLCGDAAQTVHTKHLNLKDAEIDVPPARWIRLNQNYRNSRQILAAAYEVLTRTFNSIPRGTVDFEILQPEYANFTSAKPLLLRATSVFDELAMAYSYALENIRSAPHHKVCIALCGYSHAAVEHLAANLGLPALSGDTDLSAKSLFLSDLEQTKGFEFDLMIVLNCSRQVIPHPDLPEHESFRELFKLYVALTRAKTELVVSFHGSASRFVDAAVELFNVATWEEHVAHPADLAGILWPPATLRQTGNIDSWTVNGRDFLRMREAVGLSQIVQDEILQHVTGQVRTEARSASGRRKQTEWREFQTFYLAMENPITRNGIMGNAAWAELNTRLASLIQNNTGDNSHVSSSRAVIEVARAPRVLDFGNAHGNEAIPVGQLRLHRHSEVLKFSQRELSAHTLASLLVAQNVNGIDLLEVGRPMAYSILGFLIPRHELSEWLKRNHIRQLRTNPNAMVLTKAGLDECGRRVSISKTSVPYEAAGTDSVTFAEVQASHAMILGGQGAAGQIAKFFERQFEIKPNAYDAT
ncbi:ATP-dependent DNA helicase Rep [Pandoraea pneumonica]|uniref:DNA 3'-5' helicase n=1 Tax=Pandoraea pneumonica TaxID=2508299 RepID=A0A5E4RS31_9BURK|nr:UvrD-helicase domain-containing protein [Pandoraea pneumonica]VVD64678.1 ATP-dependent DNA helicase Rep [Pandoraea pneumonica]